MRAARVIAMAAGAVAFVVALAHPAFTIYYYPLDHRWTCEPMPHGVAIDFYGRLIQAAVAWGAAFSVTAMIWRIRESACRSRAGSLVVPPKGDRNA
jgi:hypothetical protein